MLHSFALWSAVLVVCSALRSSCSAPASILCPSDALAAALSPRPVSDVLTALGPALVWAPLLVHARASSCGPTRGALLAALACWLIACMPVRLTRRLSGGAFDPSGHVFVIGVQLVPLWVARGAGAAGGGARVPLALRAAGAIEPVLWLVSASTSAFHHSAAEVFAAWALVAALVAGAHAAARAHSALLRRALAAAALAWMILAAALLPRAAGERGLRPKDFGRVAFDVAVGAVGALALARDTLT
jgi:hypothetical protein